MRKPGSGKSKPKSSTKQGKNKPNRIKELYDQIQAEKKSVQGMSGHSGKPGKGSQGPKFNSQPRSVEKKYWRQ